MKITKKETGYARTQVNSIRFEFISEGFRLRVVDGPKSTITIAELYSRRGAKVGGIIFFGFTAQEIRENWPRHWWLKPDFKTLIKMEKFWEALREKAKRKENKGM